MKRFSTVVCALIMSLTVGIVTIGCSSKELSRSEAKKIIQKEMGDGKVPGNLDSGFVISGGIPSFGAFAGVKKDIRPDDYRSMEKKGLVKLQNMGLVMLGERFLVTFPDDIRKKYVLSTQSKDKIEMNGKTYTKDISKVLLGQSSIKEITGIRQEGKDTGAKARVEFTIHIEVTPFGEIMLPKFMQGDIPFIAKFEKYDDGWRIAKDGIYPVEVAKKMGIE